MSSLRKYLNQLSAEDRRGFCERCGTTLGYLRKALSKGQQLGESLCINIDRESEGAVPVESLRPDVDWAYLRGTQPRNTQLVSA